MLNLAGLPSELNMHCLSKHIACCVAFFKKGTNVNFTNSLLFLKSPEASVIGNAV